MVKIFTLLFIISLIFTPLMAEEIDYNKELKEIKVNTFIFTIAFTVFSIFCYDTLKEIYE